MLLGDLVARFDDEALAEAVLLELNDLSLIARVQQFADREGMTSGEFASSAVQRYSTEASDEEWVTIIGQMGKSSEPGFVLLRRSLVWMTNRLLTEK